MKRRTALRGGTASLALLLGTLVMAPAALAVDTWDMGPQAVGTVSPPRSFTFVNSGEGGTIASMSQVGISASPFEITTIDPDCVDFTPGAMCTVQVVFAPVLVGAYQATVVASFTAERAPLLFNLVGVATDGPVVQANVVVSPTSIPFGTVPAGATAQANVVVTNRDAQHLVVTGFSGTGGPFGGSTTDPACGTLVTGASCTVQIRFAPQAGAIGTFTGFAWVHFDASTPAFVSVTGTVGVPELTVDPASLAFGSQTVNTISSTQTITLTNTGNASLFVSSVTISESFSAGGSCLFQFSLHPGHSCPIPIRFVPTTAGPAVGEVVITTSIGTRTVALSGVGVPPDADGDGIADASDRCPDTVPGAPVDSMGCPADERPYEVVFGSPIDEGIANVAKLGRVIPVKAQVFLEGTEVRSGAVRLFILASAACSGIPSDAVEAYAAGSSSAGNDFRWDSAADLWQFNLDTSVANGLQAGCYQAEVYVGDAVRDAATGAIAGGVKAAYFAISLKR